MTREAKETSLAVRIPSSLLATLDAYASYLEGKTPGLKVTRSDAVRYLLNLALTLRESRGSSFLADESSERTIAAATAENRPAEPVVDNGKLIRLPEAAPRTVGGLGA